jgi:hypothetical protein
LPWTLPAFCAGAPVGADDAVALLLVVGWLLVAGWALVLVDAPVALETPQPVTIAAVAASAAAPRTVRIRVMRTFQVRGAFAR